MKKDSKVTFTNWKVYSAHVEVMLLWELENLWFFSSRDIDMNPSISKIQGFSLLF
jgi:hypothetical protein